MIPSPEVENAVFGVVLVSEVAEPLVAFLAVVVTFVSEVSEPVLFVASESVPDVAEPQASGDIAVAIVVLIPFSVVLVEVYTPGRPRSLAFPNVDYPASSSSSVGVLCKESVHSSTGVRTNRDLCSVLSNLGLHQNKNSEHSHNNPNSGHNNVSGTNDLPIDATTSHSRKTSLHLYQGLRRHTSQVSRSPRVGREIRWAAAAEN